MYREYKIYISIQWIRNWSMSIKMHKVANMIHASLISKYISNERLVRCHCDLLLRSSAAITQSQTYDGEMENFK